MRSLICLFSLITMFASVGECRFLRIAVIDTGLGFGGKGLNSNLCLYGHKDFSADQKYVNAPGIPTPVPLDTHKHGTNVAGIIVETASSRKNDFCLIIIKVYSFDKYGKAKTSTEESIRRSILYARNLNADIINFSGGGKAYDKNEAKEVKVFLDQKGIFVAAAGNESQNLDNRKNHYYPAQDDSRVISVGSHYSPGFPAVYSNYGAAVKRWEDGNDVYANEILLSGTSQATAIVTGKIILETLDRSDKVSEDKKILALRK